MPAGDGFERLGAGVCEGRSGSGCARVAAELLQIASGRAVTVAVAESLTGGQVSSTLAGVPGASRVLVGAVVAYATRIKEQVLGVDAVQLERTGPVDRDVALQMARGVRRLLGADLGLATTGVAGPGSAYGHPEGTVHIAVAASWGEKHRELHLSGGRSRVRHRSVLEVIKLAADLLDGEDDRAQI